MLAECSCARAAQPPSADTPRASINTLPSRGFSPRHPLPFGATRRQPPPSQATTVVGATFSCGRSSLWNSWVSRRGSSENEAPQSKRGEWLYPPPVTPISRKYGVDPPTPLPPTPPVSTQPRSAKKVGKPIFVYTPAWVEQELAKEDGLALIAERLNIVQATPVCGKP